jgi:hypothetical protein
MVTRDESLVSLEELRSVLAIYCGPSEPLHSSAHAGEKRRPAQRTRRRVLLVLLAAAAALAAIMVATPAWALVRDVLPFWNQPSAPQSVKVEFSSLNFGAPPGMSPQAVSGETREVEVGTLSGNPRTLWVSPAKDDGFCFLWSDGPGGCTTRDQLVGWSGVRLPLQWLGADVIAPMVSSVVIRFSDGSSVQPPITWISAPIDAGFFAYNVPSDKQSAADHLTEIDAYDANGNLVKRDSIPATPDGGS